MISYFIVYQTPGSTGSMQMDLSLPIRSNTDIKFIIDRIKETMHVEHAVVTGWQRFETE